MYFIVSGFRPLAAGFWPACDELGRVEAGSEKPAAEKLTSSVFSYPILIAQ